MTTPTPDRLPWEKQKGESSSAFGSFAAYRDLGPQRSLQKVAQDSTKTIATMKKLSRAHHWVERADHYDRHVDHVRRQATEENWRVANHRHQVIAGQITSALMRRLVGDNNPRNPIPALNPKDLDWGDVRGLTKDAVAIERLVHGQPTDFALRAMAMSVEDALDHVRMLIEIARRIMDQDQFQMFVVDYAAQTAAKSGITPGEDRKAITS